MHENDLFLQHLHLAVLWIRIRWIRIQFLQRSRFKIQYFVIFHRDIKCGGSGSTWIRIHLAVLDPGRIGNADLDPDQGAWKLAKIYK